MPRAYRKPPFEGAVAIYSLHDPRTGNVRYIGKSLDPIRRLDSHLTGLKDRQHLRCGRWIAVLRAAGLRPMMVTLEWVSAGEWRGAERRYIALAKEAGADLTNITEGGDGSLGHHPSPETREKMRQAHRVRWAASPERKAAMSEQLAGVGLGPRSREERAAATKRTWEADPERRGKTSERAKAWLADPIHKKTFTDAGKAAARLPEARQKLADRNRSHAHRPPPEQLTLY